MSLSHTYVYKDGVPTKHTLVGLTDNVVRRSKMETSQAKSKTKDFGEVYTPTWVCNLQNNLVDEAFSGVENLFNTGFQGGYKADCDFYGKLSDDKWLQYIERSVLEVCCGEGAYLFFKYDTTTGIPVEIEDRFGLFDRKLLVATRYALKNKLSNEQAYELFIQCAKTVFGYEYQANSLIIARENFVATFCDFFDYFFTHCKDDTPVALDLMCLQELACKQLWQMDGLTQCLPNSCSKGCKACQKGLHSGHDGLKSVVFFDDETLPFEQFLGD